MYIALAQVFFKDGRVEAFGIEKGPKDFGALAYSLLSRIENAKCVTIYDKTLEKIGVFYQGDNELQLEAL